MSNCPQFASATLIYSFIQQTQKNLISRPSVCQADCLISERFANKKLHYYNITTIFLYMYI